VIAGGVHEVVRQRAARTAGVDVHDHGAMAERDGALNDGDGFDVAAEENEVSHNSKSPNDTKARGHVQRKSRKVGDLRLVRALLATLSCIRHSTIPRKSSCQCVHLPLSILSGRRGSTR